MWRVWCWTDERLFRRLPDVCLCGCNREYGGTDRQALLREGDAPQSFAAQQFGKVRASDYTIAQVSAIPALAGLYVLTVLWVG